MSDKEPLLFTVTLGTLRPVTGAAADALTKVGQGQQVRVEIKRSTGNTRRMAFYWVMLKVALENLADAFEGPVTTTSLHRWLKREAGLATPIVSRKTGEVIDWDYDSMSFAKMPENERADYVDWCAQKLASRLGCDPTVLMDEARAAA